MKKLLLKSILLLCALVVGTSAWADNASVSISTYASANSWTSGNAYATINLNSDVTATGLTNGNNSKYYSSNESWRHYEGDNGTITIATTSGTLNSVTFTYANGNSGIIKDGTTTVSSNTAYTGVNGKTSVVFSVGHSSGTKTGNVQITEITVVYTPAGGKPSVSAPTISPNGGSFLTSQEVSLACATDGATIYYTLDGADPTTSSTQYNAPFTITATKTVKAFAVHDDMNDSNVATAEFTKVTPITVAEARDAIDAGTGTTGVYVRGIVCEGGSALSSGAMNYWISDDGTETDKFEVYKGKGLNGANFTSTDDVRIGDIVVVTGDIKKYESTYEFNSGSQIAIYTPKVLTPTFSPAAGAVAAGTSVTISTATADAIIYYTVDGSDPNKSSSVYSVPVTIDANKTIKAFAVKDGFPDSDIATAVYTIATPCATPEFSLAAGEVEKGSTLDLSCDTEGATIYYTTNGTDPTTSSTVYNVPIIINTAMTIKAIAVKDGLANSAVATASYTIRDYAFLPLEFDGGKNELPSGMTQSGLGSDYGSSPKLKFDNTGDYLILKINQAPGRLSFDIKGNSFSNGTFKVQTSADGSAYSDLDSFTSPDNTNPSTETYDLESSVRYIKWIYTTKSSGNVALGNIQLLPQSVGVAVGESKYATYCSPCALNFTNTDVKAYKAKVDGGKVVLTKVDEVPAYTGVILYGDKGNYNIPVIASATAVYENELFGVTTRTLVEWTTGNNYYNYILQNGQFKKASNGYLKANRAYLHTTYNVTNPSSAHDYLEISFEGEEETTGVNEVTNTNCTNNTNEFFNLAGQRVAQPTKGLYIVNGKKVVIK